MDSIALIAGNGVYPGIFAAAARHAGVRKLIAAAFIEETRSELGKIVDAIEWFRVGQLGKMIAFFKKHDVKHAVMVGQIAPKNLFDLRPDFRTLLMLARLKKRNAETLFGAIAEQLSEEGIELLPATTFLDDCIPQAGHIAGPRPRKRRWEEARFGFEIAKASSKLDIGQTVIVKNGTVLAVEAFEGTNEAVKRGGALGKGGSTMVKVSKPNQDMRFDVPVIGPETITVAAEAAVDVVAVEAGRTLLLDREEIIARCERLKVTLLAVE